MVNILGENTIPNEILAIPSLTVHWYNKEKRAGRKMGHLNVSGNSEVELAHRLSQLANLLDNESFPDLVDFSTKYLDNVR